MQDLDKKSYPSENQIRELWEWCGFRYQDLYPAGKGNWGFTTFPDGHQESLLKFSVKPHPAIDLNNLFKYAVPKLQLESKMVELYSYEQSGYKASIYNLFGQVDIPIARVKLNNPALALFWAIWEVIRGRKVRER